MAKTGIFGLGSMGMNMARNIMDCGIALCGYDIAPTARTEFATAGGIAHDTIAKTAHGCDLLIIMVVDATQANDVLFIQGAATHMNAHGTILLCSTLGPSSVRAIATRLDALGLTLVDAPVSGGKIGAQNGTLTIMAAGKDTAMARAMPILQAIGKNIVKVGDEPGMGATYKVVHQLAAGVHLAIGAELMALGVKAGCDPQTLFDIVSTSAGQSWMFNDRVPHMLDDDFAPRSMVDIFIKDLGLVLQTGTELSAALPLSAAAYQMFLAASSMGHGKLDDSAIIKAYEAMHGVQVKRTKPKP